MCGVDVRENNLEVYVEFAVVVDGVGVAVAVVVAVAGVIELNGAYQLDPRQYYHSNLTFPMQATHHLYNLHTLLENKEFGCLVSFSCWGVLYC